MGVCRRILGFDTTIPPEALAETLGGVLWQHGYVLTPRPDKLFPDLGQKPSKNRALRAKSKRTGHYQRLRRRKNSERYTSGTDPTHVSCTHACTVKFRS